MLRERNWRDRSVLAAVYGRRRVGKTALIEHAFRDRTVWKFEGLEDAPESTQLALFAKELERYSPAGDAISVRSWDEAFRSLDGALAAYNATGDKPVVVFFDEFQWMCNGAAELLSDLQRFWDKRWKNSANVCLVLCGSSTSFMLGDVFHPD